MNKVFKKTSTQKLWQKLKVLDEINKGNSRLAKKIENELEKRSETIKCL